MYRFPMVDLGLFISYPIDIKFKFMAADEYQLQTEIIDAFTNRPIHVFLHYIH